MALSRTEIQKKSDAKRGVKIKSFKLSVEVVEDIAQLSEVLGISQSQLLTNMVSEWKQRHLS